MKFLFGLGVVALALTANVAFAVPPTPDAPAPVSAPAPEAAPAPVAAPATGKPDFTEADKDAEGLKPASGLKVVAFATEQQLANPVAFCMDDKGRFWVVETFRFDSGGPGNEGVYDIRHMIQRLDDDLAMRTVEDRLATVKKWLNDDLSTLTKNSERVRLVEDTDGDGRADKSTIFAEGFNNPMSGLAAGVLVRGGDVYFANMPDLWMLRDTNNDNVADTRDIISTGYGVRYNFLGHDLHGLIWGPDGRLYFSAGDRGSHVVTKEGKTIAQPDTGSVFRCDADGSNLELFATGLRNPQELAFDEYGNLFTGDNSCDHGDPARFVYIVEGGDIGWRVGYQHIKTPHPAGPWMSERLHMLEKDNTGFYLLPPIAHIASGPSGLAYDPGTGLPAKFRRHFYLCDFRAGPSSAVHSFALKPKGAGFEIGKRDMLLERSMVTDVMVGNDGSVYVTDWMGAGFTPLAKGRIYRVFDPEASKNPIIAETKTLLTEGMKQRDPAQLQTLLGHADQRVRRDAQFELALRGSPSVQNFTAALARADAPLARIHAIWGLEQLARAAKEPKLLDAVIPLLGDADEQVRGQAAKALGDHRVAAAHDALVTLLSDASPRLRLFAAMALGKIGGANDIAAVLNMLAAAEDKDAFLRHAGVMALTWIGEKDPSAVIAASNHASPSARMGVLLALRRLGKPEVAAFLDAPEPQLVLEAARAINDEPINDAMPALAKLLARQDAVKLPEPVLHRALNAHLHLRTADNATALAGFAANPDAPEIMRIEAITMLGMFDAPDGKDRVVGTWRPLEKRDPALANNAMRPLLPQILLGTPVAPDGVRVVGVELFKKMGSDQKDLLFTMVSDQAMSPAAGAAALSAMNELNEPRTDEAVEVALGHGKGALREQAIKFLARRPDAAQRLEGLLATGSIPDQQAVFSALGTLEGNVAAENILSSSMDNLLATKLAAELVLDLLDSAGASKNTAVQQKVQQYNDARPKDDPLADYKETLIGGDGALGKKVFFEKVEVSCIRCHKISGEGGIAGPDLSDIALRHDRNYFLQSIIDPNKDIAPGFENITLKMKAGKTYAGVVRAETEAELVLDAGDGAVIHADKKEIGTRTKGLSPMPQDVSKSLGKRELRNVIEFLSGLKQPPTTQPATPPVAQSAPSDSAAAAAPK